MPLFVQIILWMYGFIVLKYSGKTEQLIARNALNAQNAVCAEGIQPTRGAMIEKALVLLPGFSTFSKVNEAKRMLRLLAERGSSYQNKVRRMGVPSVGLLR